MALGLTAAVAQATTPLWMRDVKLSPDGQSIVFSYKGDLYTVSAEGGKAQQLTADNAFDSKPIWSPNSKYIVFSSDRNGGNDMYIIPAEGGNVGRLTWGSGTEVPYTFSGDGKKVIFSANIQDPASSALYPDYAMSELYQIPVNGGRIERILATPAQEVNLLKDGKSFLYQDCKGIENEWRKHHTSSITRDIWLYNAETGKHTNLTNRGGEDRNPVLSPDGKTVYFLSERKGGSMNVYSLPLDNPKEVKAVTHFKTHPVRFLSSDKKGNLCFTYDGEIYYKKANGSAKKVAIDIVRDNSESMVTMSVTRGASEATVSPDGRDVAFVVRGEVFVASTKYGTTKQITHTIGTEQGLSYSSDGKMLVYASERTGNWQLYMARMANPLEKHFSSSTIVQEKALLPSDKVERAYPTFSPDGTELAFIEDRRKLMVYNFKTKKVRQITDGSKWASTEGGFSYEWAPDGKWFTLSFIGNGHDPYSDVGLVSAEGGKEIFNLTNSGYFNHAPRWVMDGNAILFATERFGMRNHASWGSMLDLMLVFVNDAAYEEFRMSKEDFELMKELEMEQKKLEQANAAKNKKDDKKKDDKKQDAKKPSKKCINVELDGIEDRMVRLTPNSSHLGSAIVDPQGENLYYFMSFEGKYDLWKMNLRSRQPFLIQKMNAPFYSMELEKTGKNILLVGGGGISRLDLMSGKVFPVSFRGTMETNMAMEREFMFNHIGKQVKKRFYVKDMHGVNWDAMCSHYSKFLPHINNNNDFATMVSELLGELNVSHTGCYNRSGGRGGAETAELGVFVDWNYTGKGLKIEEVIDRGPFDNKHSKVKAGMIIEKINNAPIDADKDYTFLLNDLVKKRTLVEIYNPQTKERWTEVIIPISKERQNQLLYKRWVKQRAADVERWSNGRLGYVHIPSMGDPEFRTVYSDVLGKYNHCDGIVIDTRFNGGGRLHEDIEVLFSGKKYLTQVIRGEEVCDMPSRRWNKPSIMLQCESNYSNAHGTPWVYKHKKMGKLVGAPVPGTMTTVSWESLQNPSLMYGIPVVGYRMDNGVYLENYQLEPDVHVLNAPETIVKGEDTQLKKAVEELLKDIDKK